MSCRVYFHFDLNVGLVLDVDLMPDVQVATHLKGLAEKAKLNGRHVKAARVYKARWPPLLMSGLSCKKGYSV